MDGSIITGHHARLTNSLGVKTRAPSHEPDGTSRMSLSTEIVAKNDSQKLTDSAVNPLLHSSLPRHTTPASDRSIPGGNNGKSATTTPLVGRRLPPSPDR
jgi:hypothetical protein